MPKFILENTIDIGPLISTRDFLAEALERADNKFEIAELFKLSRSAMN